MFLHVKLETFFFVLFFGLWHHVDSMAKTSLLNQKFFHFDKTATDQSCYQHKSSNRKTECSVCIQPLQIVLQINLLVVLFFFPQGSWLIFQCIALATVLVKWYMRSPQTLYFDATEVWCTKIQINIQLVNKPLSYTIHMNKENSCSITTFKCVTKLFFSL